MIKYECDMCGHQDEDMKKFSYVRFLDGKWTTRRTSAMKDERNEL